MYNITEFAKLIGVTVQTLRKWDKQGKLKPAYLTKGKHRMYSEEQLNEILQRQGKAERINVGYARVSSEHQKDDLTRQINLLELFLAKQGKKFKIISDIGSGINYQKKGLKELLKLIAAKQVDTVYILYKDRLARFGFELIEEFAKLNDTKIEPINIEEEKPPEEELVEDILNIIHVFSCKLNGKRSHINKKIAQRLLDER
ncbi:Mobile element protein [Desulfurella amilsii]|uniref:Mobile element protein n=1 Tax=Desulfurella amilsii TaxID=1562698 RepID=A0A1X4XZ16_9BACT|nr:IS607 family transposase [Desulfurella amilsii]OSS42776.1 Mobile element protein [Desulfurella amilsii]OSS42851.1 Mobile element protein [Desulfurella amilsii]